MRAWAVGDPSVSRLSWKFYFQLQCKTEPLLFPEVDFGEVIRPWSQMPSKSPDVTWERKITAYVRTNFLLTREMQSMKLKSTYSFTQLVFVQPLATCQGHCESLNSPALRSLCSDRFTTSKGWSEEKNSLEFSHHSKLDRNCTQQMYAYLTLPQNIWVLELQSQMIYSVSK